jgi:hypothetical protein
MMVAAMDAQAAHWILYSITAVAFLVWLAGLRYLAAAAREPRVDTGFDAGGPTDRLSIQGVAEVDGDPERLASRTASILAKGSVGQFGAMRILSRTADAVVFEGDDASMGLGQCVRRGAIHFARLSQSTTRIQYALEVPHGKALLLGGAIFQVLGLMAIVAGFWLLNTYVADAPHPAVRAQTVQMVQVCHFLWPQFLLGFFYRKRHGAVRIAFDTLIRNLPYCEP